MSRGHDRAASQTQITVSLPKWLKEAITALAKEDDRSRSKWIVRELQKLVARRGEDFHGALPMAAEEPPEYKSKREIKPHGNTTK